MSTSWSAILMLTSLHAHVHVSSGATFNLGAVCSGVDYSRTQAKDMLRGKRLRVMDLVWKPFAHKNATAPKGWEGMDIDLLDQISWLMGFTYDIGDLGYPSVGQSWTQHVIEHQNDGDLIASFWVPSLPRRNQAIQLRGHLDLSLVLVARREYITEQEQLSEALWSWSRPFSGSLWAAIIGLVIASGIVDWIAERQHMPGHKVTTSLREYAAGVLFGGFEHPLSNSSAIYQVVLAFILLVVNSTYTANLAAYITINAIPQLTASSVVEMLDSGNLCFMPNGAQPRFDATYPTLRYVEIDGEQTAAAALRNGSRCDAFVTPKNNYDAWRTDAQNCNFEIAETIFTQQGGWMTNRQSPCVQWVRSLTYAFRVFVDF